MTEQLIRPGEQYKLESAPIKVLGLTRKGNGLCICA